MAEEIRRQENREFIAIEAAQEYKNDSVLHNHASSDDVIEVEWLDRFWRLAQDVTDNEMQSVWGRVLARQAVGNEKYSARCLEALSLLSREEAILLEKIAPFLSKTIFDAETQFRIVHTISKGPLPNVISFSSVEEEQRGNLNKELYRSIPPLHREIFGPSGFFLDSGSGWAQDFQVDMSSGQFEWWIANTRFLLKSHNERRADIRLAAALGVSPLGGEIFSLIKSAPDARYVESLKSALNFHGFAFEIGQ